MVKGFATLVTGQRGMDPKSLLTFHIDLPQSLPLPRVKAFRTTYSNNCRHFKESVPLPWRAVFRTVSMRTALRRSLKKRQSHKEIRPRSQRQNRSALITFAPCTFLCVKAAPFILAIPQIRFMLRL